MTDEIVSSMNYDESSSAYHRIKNEFKNEIKERYQCEDYDIIVNYILDYVFKKKPTKSQCISKFDSIFHDKTKFMIENLCQIIRNEENPQEISDSYSEESSSSNQKSNGYHRKKRERSRSNSGKRVKNKFDFQNYSAAYPPITPKGFYPPKGRFRPPMVPFGAYPSYMIPQMTTK